MVQRLSASVLAEGVAARRQAGAVVVVLDGRVGGDEAIAGVDDVTHQAGGPVLLDALERGELLAEGLELHVLATLVDAQGQRGDRDDAQDGDDVVHAEDDAGHRLDGREDGEQGHAEGIDAEHDALEARVVADVGDKATEARTDVVGADGQAVAQVELVGGHGDSFTRVEPRCTSVKHFANVTRTK
jgi:hypothetical protein